MSTGTLTELRNNLKALTLTCMVKNLDTSLRQAQEIRPDYAEFLLELTATELQSRARNRLNRRIKEAKFPLIKTLESFDLDAASGLDIGLVRDLAGCTYIDQRRNVIFLGRSGTGKTHLATALGIEACKTDHRARFVSCYGLVNELIEARQERTLQRMIARYARYDLLILDEMGYIPFSKEGGELLFQVLAERHEKGSVIITSNLGFADWTQVFVDQTMTAALLDRLTHKACIINCDWESYRLKQSLKLQEKGGSPGKEKNS